MNPLFVALLASFGLAGIGAIAWVRQLDIHEEERRRWTSSVPTITQLPRATARKVRR